jgi:hypothetical protein
MPTKKVFKKIISGHCEIVPVMMVDIIKNCARCGGMHANVLFKSFTRPPDKYSYFAICPTTQEPILMVFTPDAIKKKGKHAR